MAIDTFDDFNSTEQLTDRDIKPFQFRDEPNDKEKTLEWLNQNFDNKEEASRSRFIAYRRHHALYKGIHWKYQDTRNSDRDIEYNRRKPRHTVNFIHEMVEAKVSQMARFRASVALIPSNNEQSDINNAKTCKLFLDARGEEIDIEGLHQDADRVKYIFGHVFQFVEWDEVEGPIHPMYRRLQEQFGGDIPSKIKKKLRKQNVHIGDVSVKNMGPSHVFPELNVTDLKKLNEIEYIEWVHIEELKRKYPHAAELIKENKREFYDFELTEISRPANMIMVRHYFHKKTQYLPEGAEIIYCDDAILSHKNLRYDDGELPFVQDTDIKPYNEFWGRSFIFNIEQMNRYYNNIQSAQARDHGLGSAPKWVTPKGACDVSSFNNEFVLMEFKGPIAPKLVQNNPTSSQSFEIQDRLERKIGQQSQIYEISRGEVPQGVTANSALRFLDEQESQRLFTQETKRKRRVLDVYRMMLKRMGQFYKQNQERMVKTLGKNNQYLIKSFNNANFNRVYDVRLLNSSALPDTKTGKISTIVDLNTATQTDPVFRKEEIIKMLDLALDDAFKDEATVAVDAAKSTLELILEGEEYPEPVKSDNFMVFYSVFSKAIQSVNFKLYVDQETQQKMYDYILTMEMLMYERSMKNQKFAGLLAEFDNYPMFFEVPMPVMPQQAPEGQNGMDTSKIKPDEKQGEQE